MLPWSGIGTKKKCRKKKEKERSRDEEIDKKRGDVDKRRQEAEAVLRREEDRRTGRL